MDELLLRVEPDAETFANPEGAARFCAEVERKLQKVLGLRTGVEIVEPGSIPRTDFKARRVIDDRAVFHQMQTQLDEENR